MTPRESLELHVPEPDEPVFCPHMRRIGTPCPWCLGLNSSLPPRRSGCLSVLPWLALILVWVLW